MTTKPPFPISAAASDDHVKRPRLVRDWACRHCGNTAGSMGDEHERLCPRCFRVFNQGVGVGRAIEGLTDAVIDRLTAVVCEAFEAGKAVESLGLTEAQAGAEPRDPEWLDGYAKEHRELYESGEKEREWPLWRSHVLAALGRPLPADGDQ